MLLGLQLAGHNKNLVGQNRNSKLGEGGYKSIFYQWGYMDTIVAWSSHEKDLPGR